MYICKTCNCEIPNWFHKCPLNPSGHSEAYELDDLQDLREAYEETDKLRKQAVQLEPLRRYLKKAMLMLREYRKWVKNFHVLKGESKI